MSQVVNCLESNDLLSENQFRLRKGKSVEDQLLVTYGEAVRLVDKGFVVDMIFLDFSKTFDVVNHSIVFLSTRALGSVNQGESMAVL